MRINQLICVGFVLTMAIVCLTHRVQVTRQDFKRLRTSAAGFLVSFENATSYSMTTSVLKVNLVQEGLDWTEFHLRADAMGVEKLDEVDPVDWYSVLGTIGGITPLFMFVFALVYGSSIQLNMQRLEKNKIERVLAARSDGPELKPAEHDTSQKSAAMFA
jgi:hypothetical protein